ncbi:DUF7692 domain-containing protein [Halomicrococcus gelatinilyticus]
MRTDEGNEWRYAAIVRTANYYEVNKSNATAFVCDDVVALVDAAREVLGLANLTRHQREERAVTTARSSDRCAPSRSKSTTLKHRRGRFPRRIESL